MFILNLFNFKEKELNVFDHFMILKDTVTILLYFLLIFFQKYILYIAEIRIL